MQVHTRPWLGTLMLLASLFLIVVLGACGGPASSSASSPASLQTYKGNGYTIGYPQDWTQASQSQSTSFSKPDNTARLAIEIDDNPQGVSADSVIDIATQNGNKAANLKDIQHHQTSASVQFGGATWLQRAFDGTNAQGEK